MKGDSQQDRLLTEARAMVVRDYLVTSIVFGSAASCLRRYCCGKGFPGVRRLWGIVNKDMPSVLQYRLYCLP